MNTFFGQQSSLSIINRQEKKQPDIKNAGFYAQEANLPRGGGEVVDASTPVDAQHLLLINYCVFTYHTSTSPSLSKDFDSSHS